VINVDLAKEIYPLWTCRFYVDETVPHDVIQRLQDKGAQVVYVNEEQKQFSGLFWRFLVMDDPMVKRFLIRDADSLVSYREQAAVNEWLNSQKWFHTMHDYYSHTELILAGMWGGCHGVFNGLRGMIQTFLNTGNYLNSRVADQHFLRFSIYPTLAQSVLMHSSQHFDQNSIDFPQVMKQKDYELKSQFHVGMNEGSSQVVIEVNIPDKYIYWSILNEQQQLICRYTANVPASKKIELDIPQYYATQIKAQAWKVSVNSIADID